MNIIAKINLFFSSRDKLFFQSVYSDWDNYWVNQLEKSTDHILKKYNDDSFVLEIESLELELKSISKTDFKKEFIQKYEEALENELLKCIYGQKSLYVKKTEIKKSRKELLFYFLLNGALSWKNLGIKDLNTLFLEVAKDDSLALKQFLQTYGHYTSLQQRLIFQFNEEVLKTGIYVVAPADSHFILSYIELVKKRHQKLNSSIISYTPYNQVIWFVVYAYLLTNRSSFFNKKNFLKQTIIQLTNRYLVTYSELLQLLLMYNKSGEDFPIELIEILKALKKENENDIKGENQWKNWIKLLMITKQKDDSRNLLEEQDMLVKLLISSDNYLYLRLLGELQILKLVEILVPDEYAFVKSYAKELEQKKEQGTLQGKAGSEFRLVKWQIIFPVLLDNNGVGFNRSHFVRRVLQKISAHYNLNYFELLEYFIKKEFFSNTEKNLQRIFKELYFDFQDSINLPKQIDSPINTLNMLYKIRSNKELSSEEMKKWFVFLRSETAKNNLLKQLTEKEHKQLIRILYPKENWFILEYAEVINQQENKSHLQGKVSENLNTIRWQFIHSVLIESQNQVFNKQYFVERVIQKITAHYNLEAEELIEFLYTEIAKKNWGLSFEFLKILKTIYQKYHIKQEIKDKKKLAKPTEITDEIKKAEQLLIHYFGTEEYLSIFIRRLAQKTEFVSLIESVVKLGLELHYFIENQLNIYVNKKELLILFIHISMIYNSLSISEVLQKVIAFLFSKLQFEEEIQIFSKHLETESSTHQLLKTTLKSNHKNMDKDLNSFENQEELINSENREQLVCFIENAGLILLAPFLPRLFTLLRLTENGNFKDEDSKTRALFILQYAVFETTEFPEYELQLNKLLTGFSTGKPLPHSLTLTDEEKNTTKAMLEGVVSHWNKVKTIDGLREGFLQRQGKLEEKEETIELIVESKAFDMLLDTIPWNFRTAKFSWMEKPIQVRWR